MVRVEEVVGSGKRAERLAPIVIHAEEAALEDHGKSVWTMSWNHIHHPDLVGRQSRRQSAQMELSKFD